MEQFKKRIPILSLLLREKKFLINKNFQIQFMISLMMISVTSMTVIYFANDYFFYSYMHISIDDIFNSGNQLRVRIYIVRPELRVWGIYIKSSISYPSYFKRRWNSSSVKRDFVIIKKIYGIIVPICFCYFYFSQCFFLSM